MPSRAPKVVRRQRRQPSKQKISSEGCQLLLSIFIPVQLLSFISVPGYDALLVYSENNNAHHTQNEHVDISKSKGTLHSVF